MHLGKERANSSEDKFRSSAKYYTEFRKPYPPALFELIRSEFALDRKGELLDVGCGTGQICLSLAKDFRYVFGTDLSPEMVRICRENAK